MKQAGANNSHTRPESRAIGVADRLAALSEPLRLRILRLLEQWELTVGELAKVLQTPQSTISRHLKILSQAGWLVRRSEGTATLYQLVLDDLPGETRSLWIAVREQTTSQSQADEDDRRLEAVLAERRLDSRTFFGRVAGEWDDVRADLFGRGFTPVALLGLLDPDWTVADLGCGTGNASEHLAPHVKRVIAVDESAPMLKAARKRLDRFGNIDFRTGDLRELPIDTNAIDAATIILVLHHFDDPALALREALRALKPGGVLLVVDMVEHNRQEYRRTMGHERLGFGEDEIRGVFESAGFQRVRIRYLPSHPDAKGPGLFIATGRKPPPRNGEASWASPPTVSVASGTRGANEPILIEPNEPLSRKHEKEHTSDNHRDAENRRRGAPVQGQGSFPG